MKKLTLFCAALLAAGAQTALADSPLWLRNVAISPDGETIAFTYQGDIYTVPAAGGEARQITSNAAYDTTPLWSPDGQKIAFASNREGSFDIFVTSSKGGQPTRLTTHSGAESPLAWRDNDHILFAAQIMPSAESRHFKGTQVYEVSTEGGRPMQVMSMPVLAMSVAPDGRMLYQDRKGVENIWRKHERSSGTYDIWMTDGKKFSKLTDFNGHDMTPQWGDGDTYYYISEEDGTLNVYSRKTDGSEKRQLTHHTKHPVRHLSAAKGGKRLAYSWDGEIYTLTPGGEPQKINVSIVADNAGRKTVKKRRTDGATDMAASADGKDIALVVRGDVYVTSGEYQTTSRVTDTNGQERTVAISPDGKKLYYDSERDGLWQIYEATPEGADKGMAYATGWKERQLTDGKSMNFTPKVSPDGKKLAYLTNRTELTVMDLATGKTTTALPGEFNYSYTDGDVDFCWSPDSRWLLATYIGVGGWNNQDVALVKADGTEVVDLTESGYTDSNAKWVLDGKAIAWQSDRQGYKSHGSWGAENDAYIMFLDPEAYVNSYMNKEEEELAKDSSDKKDDADKKDDKKDSKKKDKKADKDKKDDAVKPLVFDLANRRNRIRKLTPNSSMLSDFYLTNDGTKLYYIAAFEGGGDLWMRDLREGDAKIVSKGVGMCAIIPDKEGKNLYLADGNSISKFNLDSKETKSVSFEANSDYTQADEQEYIFDHTLAIIENKFYDENLHGVDWQGYGKEYRKFLPYINNSDDFTIMLSELLGELNASHTGSGVRGGAPALETTAELGAMFDPAYKGDGLKVTEILPLGAIAESTAAIAPGDVITTIDGQTVKAGEDYYPMLAGKAGKRVTLGVKKADGTQKTVRVKAQNPGALNASLYRRWTDRNRQIVDSVSGGRIGYIHIQGMDGPSFNNIYNDLLGRYRNCDAVVVDTRYNGGGWLHNDVALLLSGKEYVRYMPRGRFIGHDPFSQWTKPSAMLVNESNYSDAHATPYTYQTLGLGTIVGTPVPGTMTAVWWENQVDPSIYVGIPQVKAVANNGRALENQQLNPDVVVYNTPEDALSGYDRQLIEATKLLMEQTKK